MLIDPRTTGGMPQMEGLLGNPYLQMGLGILANNQGNYGALGPALGRGMQQGLQQVQASKQFDQQNKLYQLKLAEAEREQKLHEEQQEAIRRASENNPEFTDLFRLDPKAAIKAAYPNMTSSADPYFSAVPTNAGLGRFDHRTGNLELIQLPNGQTAIKSSDDPTIRGAVKSAEAEAGAAWKPNTDIDGVLTTDAQVVRGAYGNNPIPFSGMPQQAPQVAPQSPQSGLPSNNFNTPYPVTFGAPGTTATDRAEGTITDNLGVGNPARPNPGGGIRIPTKAEQAASQKSAEQAAEFNSPEAVAKREKAKEFKQTMGNVVLNKIDDVMGRVGNLSAGFGGSVLDVVPGTDAYDLKADLETIRANFGFDRLQAMRDMSPTGGALGQVAVQELSALQASVANLDNAQSPSQLKANLKKAKQHYENWLNTLEEDPNKKQIIQSGEAGGRVGANRPNAPKKPMKGQVINGYKFKGGNPGDRNNWERM